MTELTVYTRDQWRERYLRSFQIRVPGADVREGTQPWIDACSIADQLVVQSLNAQKLALGRVLDGKTDDELDEFGADVGVTRPQPTGAIGFAVMGDATSSGGTTPLFGDELVEVDSGLRFEFTGAGTYYAGDPFPVSAIDKGPSTNLEAAAVLRWSAPRAGCDPLATVQEQPDGSGLSGGRDKATAEEYRIVLREALSAPASAGNDAEYQRLAEDSIGHGVQVEKSFTYPGVYGPGTIALAFTMKPARTGASRLPNSAQVSAVDGYIGEHFPRDDGRFLMLVREQSRDVYLKLDWSSSATGWADVSPWPPYYSTTEAAPNVANLEVTAVTDSTHFTVGSPNGAYTGATQPSAGNTIAVYDRSKGLWRRKRILSFTGTGPWVITCDTTSGASDTSYTPEVNQPVCPWSDSLDLITEPVAEFLATFGPGEIFATFYDEGARQRRNPKPPKSWPTVFTNRVEVGVYALDAIEDVSLAEGDGGATTIGTPGAFAYLQQLRWIAAYPKD